MLTRDDQLRHSNQNEQSLTQWLALYLACHTQSSLLNLLLESIGPPEKILACDSKILAGCGLKPSSIDAIQRAQSGHLEPESRALIDATLAWWQQDNHHLVTLHCQDYPALLAAIPDPPPLLHVIGDPAILGLPMIAMVGSRQPSAGGRRTARRFAQDLAVSGLGVTSGLAMGIDAASHEGALAGRGNTVGVLGTGIDLVYPACNRKLFAQMAGCGALVSEFMLGMRPCKKNFPRRNRLISGLSLGVLVVEAGLKSGSMITARFALEQGREVFAIPGSIYNPMARGCHKLISEGARLVESTADIVNECTGLLQGFTASRPETRPEQGTRVLSGAKGTLGKVLAAVGYDPVCLDAVVMEAGLPVAQVTAALVDLELQGVVLQESGGYVLATS